MFVNDVIPETFNVESNAVVLATLRDVLIYTDPAIPTPPETCKAPDVYEIEAVVFVMEVIPATFKVELKLPAPPKPKPPVMTSAPVV